MKQILLLAACMAFLLGGCTPRSRLIGPWKSSDGSVTMSFQSGGGFEENYPDPKVGTIHASGSFQDSGKGLVGALVTDVKIDPNEKSKSAVDQLLASPALKQQYCELINKDQPWTVDWLSDSEIKITRKAGASII